MKIKAKFIVRMAIFTIFMFVAIYFSVDYNLQSLTKMSDNNIIETQVHDKRLNLDSIINELSKDIKLQMIEKNHYKEIITNIYSSTEPNSSSFVSQNSFYINDDKLYFIDHYDNECYYGEVSIPNLLKRLGISENYTILVDNKVLYSDMSVDIINLANESIKHNDHYFTFKDSTYGLITDKEKSIFIITEIPSNKENYDLIKQTMLIIMTLMLFISILHSISLADLFIKPIKELQRQMVKVKSGNLDAYYYVNEKNEMHYLGKTYNLMLDKLKELIQKEKEIEEQKRIAYLHVLQAQINPHFLYNTLSTLEYMAEKNNAPDVANYINYLSDFFRISLNDGSELITLGEEINHCKKYLKIQALRYSDILDYEIKYDDNLIDYIIPKLILQPIVENAIYHGIKPSKHLGKITITITLDYDKLHFCIKDNGVGINKLKLHDIQSNLKNTGKNQYLGLSNIFQRLQLHYFNEFKFDIDSIFDNGTEIDILIPARKEEDI